jgi:hypothetical protein
LTVLERSDLDLYTTIDSAAASAAASSAAVDLNFGYLKTSLLAVKILTR